MGKEIKVRLENGEDVFLMNVSPEILILAREIAEETGETAVLQAHVYEKGGVKYSDVDIGKIMGIYQNDRLVVIEKGA